MSTGALLTAPRDEMVAAMGVIESKRRIKEEEDVTGVKLNIDMRGVGVEGAYSSIREREVSLEYCSS